MNNGNDKEVRVSNVEEIRVSSGFDLGGKIGSRVMPGAGRDDSDDLVRVLDENDVNCGENDGSGDFEGVDASSDDEDMEIEFRAPDVESSDAQNEGEMIGVVDNAVSGSGDRVGGDIDSNFGDLDGDEMCRGGNLRASVSTNVVDNGVSGSDYRVRGDANSNIGDLDGCEMGRGGNLRDLVSTNVVDNGVIGNGYCVVGDTNTNFGDLDGCEMSRGGNLGTLVSTNVVGSDLGGVDGDGLLKKMGTSFEMGDMVWAKVKSHPWWPGYILNGAFVSAMVRRSKKDGHVLVAFFGDSSYGYFDPRDLIPYDPHYGEKSQQTTSKNFVRAVEDSVDEVNRRSALGLSCRCRNPYNFRPTHVPGYLSVDVVDCEPGAVYSVRQIQRARESFHPSHTLTFVKQLASAPTRSGVSKSLDFVKLKATALAYRRSVFEEFDETYAQAFGEDPVRSQLAQVEIDKTPSRAPLSGLLVGAESLGGDRKTSTKATKPKDSSKKDRYLFKRRDEVGDLKSAQVVSQVNASSSSSSANEDGTSDSATAGYVLQKRDHGASTMDLVPTSYASPTDVLEKKLSLDVTVDSPQSESKAATSNITSPDVSLTKKKKKMVKRSSEKPDISQKRMKKLKKTDGERRADHTGRLISGEDSQLNNHKKEIEVTSSVPQPIGSVSLESLEGKELDLPQMLEDLHGLALNPVHGIETKIPTIALMFFLKFRALVYLKASTALSMAESEPPGGESWTVRSSDKPKSSKLSARHEDPSKGGRKRVPSERQEEMSVKKAKKITEVKCLSSEKRASLKNSESLRLDGKTKKKVDCSPRVEEPTYLLMKYPVGSSLPSLVELKARFARFGPLDTSLSRVFYGTNSCRVAFMYKRDAEVACNAVGSKSLFANVKFSLKPVSAPEPQPQLQQHPGDPGSNWDPPAGEPRPVVVQQQELKSCLKKPSGGDEPVVGPTTTVRASRVRFNMGEDNEEGVVSTVGMDVNVNNQRLMSSFPLQSSPQFRIPLLINNPQNHNEIFSRTNFNTNHTVIAGPPSSAFPVPVPRTQFQAPPKPSIDISEQMMSLLTRCHDVVTNVSNILGYEPYHPL